MRVVVHGSELAAATAAAALCSVGHQVTWMPHAEFPWESLSRADWLVSEPGLKDQILAGEASGQLTIVDRVGPESDAEVHWLALSPDQREAAERYVEEVPGRQTTPLVIVNNSTFPVGQTEKLEAQLGHASQIAVALPDRLEEGRAWDTFTRPAHWLLGSEDEWATQQIRELLRAFSRRHEVYQLMPRKAAELTKLAINGMLATRISFMNELAGLADSLGVDVEYVRQGMGADTRIGFEYLYPGCGFGGPNFSRDLMRLADVQHSTGRESHLLEHVLDINESKKETLFRKLWNHFQGELEGRTIAIWGAAFKPGTARIDQAPVLTILEALWAQGVKVKLHDPAALHALAELYPAHPQLELVEGDFYAACEGADALMLVTEWKCYWNPDWRRLLQALKTPLILDGRNIFDPTYVASRGFVYRGIGRRA
ncbi:nucleotide sugar dehydrogenase [Salinicola sp. JS01]|uniref:nucleotide sugar dehydrogenase n=1 Tax=Salinicola sp. JS01 TaxID=3050071 RepID=UPI00255BF6C9|nr:nucleotide sugar dehydrogenase [Salinicola sp. JS01]WIX34657.1 nucleotide sugar dehydrogenase [Salinicola sp. JS01]